MKILSEIKNNYLLKIFRNDKKYVLDIRTCLFFSKRRKVFLPRKTKKFVFIKSPHVDKASKEHFSLKIHKEVLFLNLSMKEICLILRNIPKGMSVLLKINK